jgi:hypothetical protein
MTPRHTINRLFPSLFSDLKKKILHFKGLIWSLSLLCVSSGFDQLQGAPRISEFVALNTRSLVDEDGDSSDWIEIENTDDNAVSLGGWYLTDDPKDLTKWEIPTVTLLPNDFLIIFASNKNRIDPASNLHTNFTLSPRSLSG